MLLFICTCFISRTSYLILMLILMPTGTEHAEEHFMTVYRANKIHVELYIHTVLFCNFPNLK